MPNAMRPPAPPRPRAPELHTGGDPGGPPEQLDVLVFPKDVQPEVATRERLPGARSSRFRPLTTEHLDFCCRCGVRRRNAFRLCASFHAAGAQAGPSGFGARLQGPARSLAPLGARWRAIRRRDHLGGRSAMFFHVSTSAASIV